MTTIVDEDDYEDDEDNTDCDFKIKTSLVMSAATHSTGLAEAIPLNASLNVTSCKAYLQQKILQKIFT